MNVLQNDGIASPLTRTFIPCRWIVTSRDAASSEALVGARVLRMFLQNDYPVCRIEKGGFIVCDYGCELSGGVRLVTSAEMGRARVRIRFGESVSEAMGAPDMDHAIHDVELPVGAFSSIDFGSTGFRFVRLDVVEGTLGLCNAIAFLEWREAVQTGRFQSSDPLLNRIFDTAVHTVHLNMQDYLLDGVKRDRLVWGGDMHAETLAVLRAFGAHPVLRDSLELLRTHTAKGNFINGFSSYSLWYFITLHDYWLHCGDDSLLRDNADCLEEGQRRFDSFVDDTGCERLPEERFLDWPSRQDPKAVHAGLQALCILGFTALEKMLTRLGRDAAISRKAIERLRRHAPDPGNNKAAAALQHLAGFHGRRAVLEQAPFQGVSTFLGYYMLLAKDTAAALNLVRAYWGGMLKLGATSFWEDFNLDWAPNATGIDELPVPGRPDIHADFGAFCYRGLRHSLCHGWASGPAAWCSQRLLGVEPLEPGFRTIRFQPELCELDYAEGTVPTPHGLIRVTLQKGKKPDILLPPGVSIASPAAP